MADELEADWSKSSSSRPKATRNMATSTPTARAPSSRTSTACGSSALPRGNAGAGRGRPVGCRSRARSRRRTTRSITPPRDARSAMAISSSAPRPCRCRRRKASSSRIRKDLEIYRQAGADRRSAGHDPWQGDLRHRCAAARHEICLDPAPARCCCGTVKSYDATKTLAFPGVEKVVEIPSTAADKPRRVQGAGRAGGDRLQHLGRQ